MCAGHPGSDVISISSKASVYTVYTAGFRNCKIQLSVAGSGW